MIRLNCFFTLADEEKKKAFVSLAQELVEKSRTDAGCIAQFKQKQRKVKMRGMNCKWLRMSNIS